jgi:hypothetical protein
MSLYLEFDKIVHQLAAARVRFAVVGGLAVGLHGYVRATEDIDLLVAENDEAPAVKVLRNCGYLQNAQTISFSKSGLRLQRFYRRPPAAEELLVVDLLYPESETTRGILDRAQARPYRDIAIGLVQPADLISMKQLRDSKMDQADVEFLKTLHERQSTNDRDRTDHPSNQ